MKLKLFKNEKPVGNLEIEDKTGKVVSIDQEVKKVIGKYLDNGVTYLTGGEKNDKDGSAVYYIEEKTIKVTEDSKEFVYQLMFVIAEEDYYIEESK